MAWYKVAESYEPEQPFIRKVKAGSKFICLINSNEKLYALSNYCPHAGADLSKGWCEHDKVVCPYHRYSYDLVTGKGSPGQNDYINTYKVDVRADGVYVQVLSVFEKLFK